MGVNLFEIVNIWKGFFWFFVRKLDQVFMVSGMRK